MRLTTPYVNNAPRPTPYDKQPKPTKDEDDEIIANPPNTHALKEAIDRRMRHSLEKGMLYSRSGVLYSLEVMGLKIMRSTKSSISVAHPAMKRNIRLKGAIYEEDFKALSQRAHLIEDLQQEYERKSYSRGYRDLMTWKKGMEIKKEYHQGLYGDIKAPEPLEIKVIFNALENQSAIIDSKSKIKDCTSKNTYNPRP